MGDQNIGEQKEEERGDRRRRIGEKENEGKGRGDERDSEG